MKEKNASANSTELGVLRSTKHHVRGYAEAPYPRTMLESLERWWRLSDDMHGGKWCVALGSCDDERGWEGHNVWLVSGLSSVGTSWLEFGKVLGL